MGWFRLYCMISFWIDDKIIPQNLKKKKKKTQRCLKERLKIANSKIMLKIKFYIFIKKN